jgi:subtilisin family serine protease
MAGRAVSRVRRLVSALICTALAGALLPAAAQAAPGPADAPEYWFDTWHINQLWQNGARGNGVTIAEIDTGVNANLPELVPNVLPGKDFGTGGDGHIDREVNTFGHGTAMASIMVGQPGILGITGLAPGAKLLPIAVPLSGTTDAGRDDHLPQAIRWAVDHGGKVISMSLGGARKPNTDSEPCPRDEQAAVYYALRKGAVLLASGGNQGQSSSPVEEPGVCLGVISVGAVDSSNTVASFSSRHPYLTLTAPGVNIASLSRILGSAYSGDGTSQSTAVASAVVALVWSKYPKLTGRQVVARVLATTDRHTAKPDPAYGYGVINAYRAATASVPADAPNPVYAAADPFVGRLAAFDKQATTPKLPAAGDPNRSTGPFRIGNAPRLLVAPVLEGLAVAAAGLLALIALLIIGLLRRRRAPQLAPAQARSEAGLPDPTGLVWHEIIGPENQPDPFTR